MTDKSITLNLNIFAFHYWRISTNAVSSRTAYNIPSISALLQPKNRVKQNLFPNIHRTNKYKIKTQRKEKL